MMDAWSFWRQSRALATLMYEAQSVVALRMLGMAGLWPVPRGENQRMVSEKMPAFTESWVGASTALMTGKGPDAVVTAWSRPLTKKARRNRKRLSRG